MVNTVVFDCPRCESLNSTMEIKGYTLTSRIRIWEFLALCRSCKNSICIQGQLAPINLVGFNESADRVLQRDTDSAVRALAQKDLNISDYFNNIRFYPVLKSVGTPPEHLPSQIQELFEEASKCLSIGCFNAAGAMFRLCLDITTKDIISKNLDKSPTADNKKTIHKRLEWIFEKEILPKGLEDLSRCIKDDGNDAAHDGNIGQDEAEDLLDFTKILLERIYTEPENIRIAAERRQQRRKA